MHAEHCQILIAGGGPSGMVLAYALALQGIEVRVLESASHSLEDMRASTIHPPTLDMLETLGLREELERIGLKAPVYKYHNRQSGASYAFDLGDIADLAAYPYRLQCEQFKLVRVILERLKAMPNAHVEFSTMALHFAQDEDGVTVSAETPMAIKTYRTDYLIGADGANSTVRKWLGTEFDGFTYPEFFLTLSTNHPIEQHLPWVSDVNYVADPPKWCVLLRVPDLWRVLVPVSGDEPDDAVLSDARKDAVFRQLLGPDGPTITTHHRTVYRVHQRVAKRFRDRRVLLIGDAAHLNNPLGGFGMNSGIHDAWNLKDKLLPILLDRAPADPLLDRYERQRRQVAYDFVQAQTIANKKALEEVDASAARDAKFGLLTRDRDARRAYLLEQSMYACLKREAEIP